VNTFANLRFYNSKTRSKEIFIPRDEKVTFYSCGQTVYDSIHVGNAKTYLVWDLLVRFLRFMGHDVRHVQNFTDVGHLTDDADQGEDKIARRAKLQKLEPMELVDTMITEYYRDMDRLNVLRPNIAPRATGHISEMESFVIALLDRGFAYESDGSVYFNTSKFPRYGEMAGLNLDGQKAGARIGLNAAKRHPSDFALWIRAPPEHLMKYSSPLLSIGYPGWHLECSVMSMKYLGDTLDIHAGGEDHIPVHHTNEIAQSESYTGKEFSRFWLHSAFITVKGQKMGKSLGNFILLSQLLEEVGGPVSRMVLMGIHYRTHGDFSWEQVRAMESRYRRMLMSIQDAQRRAGYFEREPLDFGRKLDLSPVVFDPIMDEFVEYLSDDLNTPGAFKVLFRAVDKLDSTVDDLLLRTVDVMLSVLGIDLPFLTEEETEEISHLLKIREEFRKNRQWNESDFIREYLQERGYLVEDGSGWYRVSLR